MQLDPILTSAKIPLHPGFAPESYRAIKPEPKRTAASGLGRANLAIGVLLIVFAVIAFVPSGMVQVTELVLRRPVPAWHPLIPLAVLAFLIFFFQQSLKMIPR